jgi:hypothetical protein
MQNRAGFSFPSIPGSSDGGKKGADSTVLRLKGCGAWLNGKGCAAWLNSPSRPHERELVSAQCVNASDSGTDDDGGYGTAQEGFGSEYDFTEDEEDEIDEIDEDEPYRSNFTGVFKLAAVEGLQEFMQAMGVPWIVAKSAAVAGFGNKASVEVNLVGNHCTLVETGGWLAHSVQLKIGAPRKSRSADGSAAVMKWEGRVLQCSWTPQGTPVQCWRHMQDQNTLVAEMWVESNSSAVCTKTWMRA